MKWEQKNDCYFSWQFKLFRVGAEYVVAYKIGKRWCIYCADCDSFEEAAQIAQQFFDGLTSHEKLAIVSGKAEKKRLYGNGFKNEYWWTR